MFEYLEPIDVQDVLVNGIARVEPLHCGLVRIWLYADEGLSHPMKVIRCKLVIPLPIALEMNAEVDGALKAIDHQQTNRFRVVRGHRN